MRSLSSKRVAHDRPRRVLTLYAFWSPRAQELCGYRSYRSHFRSYPTGLDRARACHRRETGIGAIGAIGVLSEYYRRSTIELSNPPSRVSALAKKPVNALAKNAPTYTHAST